MVCTRFGRRRVLIPILLAMSGTGILTAVMPSYASFMAARVLNAFIVIAIYETAFTYLLELVGGPYSTVVRGGRGVHLGGGLAAARSSRLRHPGLETPRAGILGPKPPLGSVTTRHVSHL